MLPAVLVVAMFVAVWTMCAVKAWKKRHEAWGDEGATDAMADGWHDFTGVYHLPPMSPLSKGAPPARSEPMRTPPPSIDSSTATTLGSLAGEIGGGQVRFRFYCTRTNRPS